MKLHLLFFICLAFCKTGFTQSNNETTGNPEKYRHTSAHLRMQEAGYYQYPSMHKYDVKYLKLDLTVEAGNVFLSGTALTVAKVLQPLDSFNIELRDNMILDSVFINGVKKVFQRGADHIFIPLSPALAAGTMVSALFYYNGSPLSGVYTGSDQGDGHLTWTASLSESFQAREWFPVKQILTDKIDSADIWIKTSAINKVGSNGLLVAVADSPNNKKQYQWKSRYPMSYYMPSFSVGNYLDYRNYAKPAAIAPDSLLILNYIVNDSAYFNSIRANLDMTPAFIEKFSELYGLYPFRNEKYGHSHAYIGGCMEHQTMSTMSNFGSTVIAHELSHQWFGDNVTCSSWNHIWLNEGFASYSEYLAIEKLPALFPATTAPAYMQAIHDDVLSIPDGSVYVSDVSAFDENRIFNGRLTYNKGSAIIHNLRFEMQDDNVFFQTLKNYQLQFKDSVATADDFKHVAEVTSGKNFTDFFNQWYYGEGYPTFNIIYTMQGTDTIVLNINETVSAPAVTPFFKGLYEFKITSAQGDTTVKVSLSGNDQQFKFGYNKSPDSVIVDPNNWVLNQTGTVINGGVVLPVALLSFLAETHDCIASLKWKTENDPLIKQFDVEYSTDGSSFRRIATINSKHPNNEYEYEYGLDGSSTHFFRLKIIKENGVYNYSNLTSVNKTCNSEFSIKISPNPVEGKIYLTLIQPTAGNTIITIFDSHGSVVYKKSEILNEGRNQIQLPVQNLSHGTYMLKAVNLNNASSKKFIKI